MNENGETPKPTSDHEPAVRAIQDLVLALNGTCVRIVAMTDTIRTVGFTAEVRSNLGTELRAAAADLRLTAEAVDPIKETTT